MLQIKSFVCIVVTGLVACLGPYSNIASAQELTAERMFAPDRITDIQIELPEADWDKTRKQSRSFGEALSSNRPEHPFEYVKANVTIDGVLIKDVGIRKKGFLGSLNVQRPSLKIKFEEYVKQSPVAGLDRLTLNNNNQDPSRVCQYLSFKLFRESGTVAPRCGFAKVTVNGEYLGLYSNVEAIKPDFLKHAFGDASGALFEGTVTDFMPDWTEKFESKNSAAKPEMTQAVANVFLGDGDELEKLKEVVDVEAFTKFWAMESLIGFWDGYCSNQNNYYIYRHPKNDKFYFIPWGTDSSFTDASPIPPYYIVPKSVHAKAIIPNRLYRIKESKQAYVDTLMSLLKENWNEKELVAEIDRLEAMLEEHVEEGNTGFKSGLKGYRRFIEGRREAIMAEFKDGHPELKSREKTPVYFSEVGTAEITFSTTWFKGEPKNVEGTGEISLDAIINGKKLELKNVGVYAKQDDRDANNASIIIMGNSEATGKQIIIGAGMAKASFLPGKAPVSAGGVIIQPGRLGMLNAKMKMMFGTITLEEASMEPGAPVKGTMSFSIGEFKMGENRSDD